MWQSDNTMMWQTKMRRGEGKTRQGEAPGHCLGVRRGAVGSIASSTRYLSVARTAKMRHFKQLRVDKLKMVVCVCVRACQYHAGRAPDVSRRSILCSNQNLQSSVLSGLNVLSEVFVLDKRQKQRGEPSDWSVRTDK